MKTNKNYKLFTNKEAASVQDSTGVSLNVCASRTFFENGDRSQSYYVNEQGQKIKTNTPSTLQYDEWKSIDDAVKMIATDRLSGISDLIGSGLTHNLGSVGQVVSLWDKESDMTPAEANMTGESSSEGDNINFEYDQVPVPVISKNFKLNWRTLEASRKTGEALDVRSIQSATRLVAEKSEDMLFNGLSNISVNGAGLYGYTNHPSRNTVDMATQWTAVTDYQDIVDDVQAMLSAARADKHFGPYVMYIPGEYEGTLDEDFKANSDKTLRQRLLQLSGLFDIRISDRLANHNVVLVQMTSDVVDLAVAQGILPLEWSTDGGMTRQHKVLAVWAPRLKADYDGKMGLVHLYEI
jgi:uncharacterized linocin/CFP29 family protein